MGREARERRKEKRRKEKRKGGTTEGENGTRQLQRRSKEQETLGLASSRVIGL